MFIDKIDAVRFWLYVRINSLKSKRFVAKCHSFVIVTGFDSVSMNNIHIDTKTF